MSKANNPNTKLLKSAFTFIIPILAALASPISLASDALPACASPRATNAKQLDIAKYDVAVDIYDQKSLNTRFGAIVETSGKVANVQVETEFAPENSEPVIVGVSSSLQTVEKENSQVLRVCIRMRSIADQLAGAPVKINESSTVLNMPLQTGEEARSKFGPYEMVVKVVSKLDARSNSAR